MKRREFIYLLGALPFTPAALGFSPPNYSKVVYPGKSGKLVYVPDENGNTIPDFSNCGYMGGGVKLPDVPVRAEIAVGEGDVRERIQATIDKVSKMPMDKRGFRGAVLIKKGVHKVSDTILIKASGVVLRGEGQGENGTVLVATKRRQDALIEIKGQGFDKITGTARHILDSYVPVGSQTLKLDSVKDLRIGQAIVNPEG